jgi:hypothetical protein
MYFNDRQVVSDSKWQPAAAKVQVQGFVNALKSMYPAQGRVRPLFNIIKQAATDGYRELGNVGTKVTVPLHQAMLILSNGVAGSDAQTTGPGASLLSQYLSKGRFPEDNTVQPKTPLPVISVWLPSAGYDEFRNNAQEFMQGLANPDIGGFYDVIRAGQGGVKGPKLVTAVRTRFNQLHIVKWRVSCISPSVTQTFKLVFTNTSTPILGDSTFKDVPMGIDPTAWPLGIDVDYTQKMAVRDPIEPGGKFTVYGDFCWGGEKDRAEVYFIPAGTQPPATIAGTDIEAAKRTQQQLIASGMRGKALQSSDRDIVFEAPDQEKILSGSGDAATVRVVLVDNKAHRMSGVTATTVLSLKAKEKSLPVLYIVGGALALVIVALLVVIMLRSGKKRPGGPAPAPVVAGGAPYAPMPHGGPMGGAPGGYGGSPAYSPAGHGGAVPAFGAPGPFASPPAAAGGEGMYGAPKAAPYGATVAVQQPGPPEPYRAPGGGSRAVLNGAAGTYAVSPNIEMSVGRDPAKCHVTLTEPRVSSVHATLKFDGGQLYVRDENSNNGTFVDGHRLAPGAWTVAPTGSALRFGPVEFAIRLE